MQKPTYKDIRACQKKRDSLFAALLFRRVSAFVSMVLLRLFPRITPSTVTSLALILALIAALTLAHDNYWIRILGVVLLFVYYTLDCCDGEIARYADRASLFGGFYDSFADRIKEIVIFAALGWRLFETTQDPLVMLAAFGAATLTLLVGFVRKAKHATWSLKKGESNELSLTDTMYLGQNDTVMILLWLSIIFQQEYLFLLVMIAGGLLSVIRQVHTARTLPSA